MPCRERRLDPIREASCLAHVVPGVSLRLPLANDEHLLVSHVCLGADLDPCQLRSALIADRTHGLRMLTDMIVGAEIVSGLVDLGGGLFQRVWSGAAERWFTSTLDPQLLAETLCRCPADAHDVERQTQPATGSAQAGPAEYGFDIVVKPDEALGLSAVCVRCHDERSAPDLDDVATRALAACLVAELLDGLDDSARR